MKLHGFARENIWILKEHIKTNISDKVILNLPITKNIKTEWDFPWDCELNIEIELTLKSLTIDLIVCLLFLSLVVYIHISRHKILETVVLQVWKVKYILIK